MTPEDDVSVLELGGGRPAPVLEPRPPEWMGRHGGVGYEVLLDVRVPRLGAAFTETTLPDFLRVVRGRRWRMGPREQFHRMTLLGRSVDDDQETMSADDDGNSRGVVEDGGSGVEDACRKCWFRRHPQHCTSFTRCSAGLVAPRLAVR